MRRLFTRTARLVIPVVLSVIQNMQPSPWVGVCCVAMHRYWCSDISDANWMLLREFMTVDPNNPPPVRQCAGGPPSPPLHIERNSLCVSVGGGVSVGAPVGMGPCTSAEEWAVGGGRVSLWNDTMWFVSFVAEQRGHSSCVLGNRIILESSDNHGAVSVDGDVLATSCAGLCAGVVPSVSDGTSSFVQLTLVNCSSDAARGFSVVPVTHHNQHLQ